MKRIEVTSCGGCPFNHDDTCTRDEDGRAWVDHMHRHDQLRPDWCPLDAGPVVVMAPTVDGKVHGRSAMVHRGRLHRPCESCPTVRACQNADRCNGAPGTEADLAAPDIMYEREQAEASLRELLDQVQPEARQALEEDIRSSGKQVRCPDGKWRAVRP